LAFGATLKPHNLITIRDTMPDLHGYSETYRDAVEILRTAPKEVVLAVKELAASGCIECPNDGKFPRLCQAIIEEKRSAA
jgi:hypothetical protein